MFTIRLRHLLKLMMLVGDAMTLKSAFKRVIRRAVCDKKYVDVLQVKKRKQQCIRVPSIQADCILIIFYRGDNCAIDMFSRQQQSVVLLCLLLTE
jgi:hypothetical protein